MKRRSFINKSLLSTIGIAGIGQTLAASNLEDQNTGKPFNLDFAFHDGMFKNHGGANFTDQITWAYDQGFRSIEDNGMLSRSVQQQEEIGNLFTHRCAVRTQHPVKFRQLGPLQRPSPQSGCQAPVGHHARLLLVQHGVLQACHVQDR